MCLKLLLFISVLIISSDCEYHEEFYAPYFETLDIDLEQTERDEISNNRGVLLGYIHQVLILDIARLQASS